MPTDHIGTPTLASLNQRNTQFWKLQTELFEQRISDNKLFSKAMCDMAAEERRNIPVYYRKTFETALEDAADAKATFHGESCQKGGRAAKSDPLQKLIEKLLQGNLQMNAGQLWHALRKELGKGVITAIDPEPSKDESDANRKIHFVAADGKVKTAPVCGLKYRLSRAKKKITVSEGG